MNKQNIKNNTEMQIKINDESLHVDHVLERVPKNFSIKGNTAVAIIYNAVDHLVFDSNAGRYVQNGNRVTYTPRKGDNAGNSHFWKYRQSFQLDDNSTYTIVYRVHKVQKDNVRLNGWGQIRQMPLEEGYNVHTFTNEIQTDTWGFYTNLTQEGINAATGTDVMLDIELIGFFKGTDVAFCTMHSGVISVGSLKNIEISTQTDAPIIGEYEMQGDAPDRFNHIEDAIESCNGLFDMDWM